MLKVPLHKFVFYPLFTDTGVKYKIQSNSVKFDKNGLFRYTVACHNGHFDHYTQSFHTGWQNVSNVEDWDFMSQITFWYKGKQTIKPFLGDFILTKENDVIYIIFPKGYQLRVKNPDPHYIIHSSQKYCLDTVLINGDNETIQISYKEKTIIVSAKQFSFNSQKIFKHLVQ